jgi:ABC-2 type transport system ATP-binding protein
MSATATVSLSRKGWGASRTRGGRSWHVLIDGNVVSSLSSGQTIELPLDAGHHGLSVKSMRFLRSSEQSFDVAEERVIGYSCRPRARSPMFIQRSIILLLLSLAKHDAWITLSRDESQDGARAVAPKRVGTAVIDRQSGSDPATVRAPAAQVAKAPMSDRAQGPVALVVDQLSKRFGPRTAFSEVSFDVAYGEVFGFLGPNGAGKTTTVRTLGTLISPTSGSAVVAGIPLSAENGAEIRRSIAIMPEAPGLYLRLTVTENLEYFAGLFGLHNPGAKIKEALAAVNLADRADDLCGGLSKGLRQRVGLARTLLSDPKIMFLDEPTSGLDPVAAREVHELIGGLRQRGVTIFLTTHRLDEAERLCDRVAILNTTLRTIGTPEELRASLFKRALVVKTLAPLNDPDRFFAGLSAVDGWQSEEGGSYVLAISDPRVAAPAVTRALVGIGADVLSISEAQHSLEDVYLELVDEDVEARK